MPPKAIVGPSVPVVFILLSEAIDGGIIGQRACIDPGFQEAEGFSCRFWSPAGTGL